jgi:hypothetical protein
MAKKRYADISWATAGMLHVLETLKRAVYVRTFAYRLRCKSLPSCTPYGQKNLCSLSQTHIHFLQLIRIRAYTILHNRRLRLEHGCGAGPVLAGVTGRHSTLGDFFVQSLVHFQ